MSADEPVDRESRHHRDQAPLDLPDALYLDPRFRAEIVAALPRYVRLYLLLREGLESGRLPSPSFRSVQEQYRVSMAVARQAMALLSQRGLVNRRRGRPARCSPHLANNAGCRVSKRS